MGDQPGEVIDHLREHGPSPPGSLPRNVETFDLERGVWKFKPRGAIGAGSASGGTGGRLTLVYYLRDEHDPREVVAAWVDANQRAMEHGNRIGIRHRLRRCGDEFHDAIDALVPLPADVVEEKSEIGKQTGGGYSTCPICEDRVSSSVKADHITECANGGEADG